MLNNKQPWDSIFEGESIVSAPSSLTDYLDKKETLNTATIAGTERIEYGRGKPVRISIIGDLKHDPDQ